jgi:hypothetical protein
MFEGKTPVAGGAGCRKRLPFTYLFLAVPKLRVKQFSVEGLEVAS